MSSVAGVCVRPFGAMFFGPLADRIGRNTVLATTMTMMALGTVAIGLIPSEQSIGIWAPLLLLLARLVRGFSTGGEYGNAMTFIAEYAPDRRRGFLGSWLEVGTFTGYLLGAIVVTVADATSRLTSCSRGAGASRSSSPCRSASSVSTCARGSPRPPAFAALEKEADERELANRSSGGTRQLAALWPFVLVCMGLVIVWNVTNYMLTSEVPAGITSTVPHATGGSVSTTRSQVLQIVVMVLALLTIPFVGEAPDRVGRKPILLGGCIALVVLAFPMVLLLRSDSAVGVVVGLLARGLVLICFSATLPSTLPALFPTRLRGTGLSVSFDVAVSLFAGTTSVAVGALVGATGDLSWPAYTSSPPVPVPLVAVATAKLALRRAGSQPPPQQVGSGE